VTDADPPTGAILLIGDELLSGKIRDANGHYLAKGMRRRGIRLVELAMVGDDLEIIGDTLRRLVSRADIVFTSGGVGPTHDDITLEAIAKATDRPLERHPEMEAMLRSHYGERISDAALSMADVPRGTVMRAAEGWPVLRLDLPEHDSRVYILPGVPTLLRMKFEHLESVEGELPQSGGWHLCVLYSDLDESSLAPHLDRIVEAYGDVDIGSYPRWSRDPEGKLRYHVQVTFEAPKDLAARAEGAKEALAAAIGPDRVVEPPEPS
jgi:molybdenum cofactor synthesis domain-containing protein